MRGIYGLLILLILLAGCAPQAQFNAPGAGDTPLFVPPTLAPTSPAVISNPTSQPGQAAAVEVTPTMECTNTLSFVEDLSIPDGSVVAAKSTLDKRWSVRNNGTCNWGEGYTIRLVAGPEMGVESQQALVPARSGTDAVIRIQFTAPEESGSYISAWQAFTPGGQPFGDQFFINITVATP